MREVAVIGIGMTDFGEHWELSIKELFVKAAHEALTDANIDKVDSIYVGSMSPGLFCGQEHIAPLLQDYLGMKNIPSTRVESACASGGLAFRQGFIEVASGVSDFVLVSGVEKMTDVSSAQATYALATAADQDMEVFHGATFPGLYAMMATHHINKYGTTREDLALVAVKNHENGLLNPHAQFKMKISVEQVIKSAMVADPLTLLDCSPITDGAAAAVLCPLDFAKKLGKNPVIKVSASAHATDTFQLAQRDDISFLKSTAIASQKAYKMAGITPQDIDFAEVHDCFTIAEIMVIEALGFCEKGKGGIFTKEGNTRRDGKIPINPSGGLKSKGHPVGATGVAQVCEVVTQLRKDGKLRQLNKAERGLCQNMGGTGASTLIHILEVVK